MSDLHIVTSNAVKVSVGAVGGNTVAHILRSGDVVPEGVDEAVIERLVARGFVTKTEIPEVDVVETEVGAGEKQDTPAKPATRGTSKAPTTEKTDAKAS